MLQDRPLRVGIIGLGRVASLLEDDPLRTRKPCSHAGAYAAHPETRLVAGADIEADPREAFGKRWGVDALYEDYREMLEAEALDIVSVCAYADLRANMVNDTARRGVRGIWCEKAIATSLDEARQMVDICRQHDVAAVVNHPRRWSSTYREVHRRILHGDIGEPEAVVACFSGNLIHTGTHAFDVMRMFLGEVREVSGRLELDAESSTCGVSGYKEGEDEALGDIGGHATLFFQNGAIGTVHAHAKAYFVFSFDVIGREGTIKIGNELSPVIGKPGPSGRCTDFKVLHPEPLACDEEKVPVAPQVDDLVRAIKTGAVPSSTLDDGAKALEIALAIHASHQSGRPVTLPLADRGLRVASR